MTKKLQKVGIVCTKCGKKRYVIPDYAVTYGYAFGWAAEKAGYLVFQKYLPQGGSDIFAYCSKKCVPSKLKKLLNPK